MKKLILAFILSISMATSFGQSLQARIDSAKAYVDTNIINNTTRSITPYKLNVAYHKVIHALEYIDSVGVGGGTTPTLQQVFDVEGSNPVMDKNNFVQAYGNQFVIASTDTTTFYGAEVEINPGRASLQASAPGSVSTIIGVEADSAVFQFWQGKVNISPEVNRGLRTASSITGYHPLVWNSTSGELKRITVANLLAGSTPTWQQTLTAGSTLTTSHQVNHSNQYFNMYGDAGNKRTWFLLSPPDSSMIFSLYNTSGSNISGLQIAGSDSSVTLSSGSNKVKITTSHSATNPAELMVVKDTVTDIISHRAIPSGGGSMVYPGAGIAVSTGSAWGTSITDNSTNWNTAYSQTRQWDGGATSLVAGTGRTSLGGTTIGQNLFTLTNPGAIRFPRFNADNTVTPRTSAELLADIGAQASGSYALTTNNLSDLSSASSARNNILPSKSGNALKVLRVNAGETDYELATPGAGGSTTTTDNLFDITADVLTAQKTPLALTDGATITWDASTGYNAVVTLGGNRTLSITNPQAGDFYTITVIQDGTGFRSLTFPDGTIARLNLKANDSTTLSAYYRNSVYEWRSSAPEENFVALTSTYTLTSTTSSQKLFNATTNGALAVAGSTSYFFECQFVLSSMSATSGNTKFDLLGAGTATLTSTGWTATGVDNTTPGTSAAGGSSYTAASISSTNVVPAGTGTGVFVRITGIFRVNAGGTIIPSVALTTAAAAVVGVNSYFKCTPIGSNTVTNVGGWN